MPTFHAELASDHQSIVLVAAGDPHELAQAARRLELLTPLFSTSTPPGALTVPLTWPVVVQLRTTFGPQLVVYPALQAWINGEALRRSTPLGPEAALVTQIPEGLTPYPWQVSGALMIAGAGGALITDEPGTGKTITAILGLLERAYRAPESLADDFIGPVIVICPASVIDSWVEAWRTWAPHVTVTAWRGPKRKTLAGGFEVYVTSYETARVDTPPSTKNKGHGPLRDLKPVGLVVDECHLIKNHNAERTKSVHRIAQDVSAVNGTVVCLSGTPITHHPGDLWSALYAITPGAWPAKGRWVNRYCLAIEGDYDTEILGLHPATEPEFRVAMLGQHRRIAKADVLTQLPPKVYTVRTVDMPARWRKVYDDFEAKMLAELPDGTELKIMDVLAKLTHLSGLSSAAADVRYEYGPDVNEYTGQPKEHVHLDLRAPSWKVDELLEVLEERPGEPVVVFAQSRQLVMLAEAAAKKAGRKVGVIVGGQSAGARTDTVNAFQAGQLDLVCVTTGAGGVGLTLTAARTVVFLQRPWSLVESIQAEDRCHRIGSEIHDSIEVIDIVARNTLDQRVRAVLHDRAQQLADLVQDPRIVAELLGGRTTHPQPEEAA